MLAVRSPTHAHITHAFIHAYIKTQGEKTALMRAANKGHADCVRVLVEAGAVADVRGI